MLFGITLIELYLNPGPKLNETDAYPVTIFRVRCLKRCLFAIVWGCITSGVGNEGTVRINLYYGRRRT